MQLSGKSVTARIIRGTNNSYKKPNKVGVAVANIAAIMSTRTMICSKKNLGQFHTIRGLFFDSFNSKLVAGVSQYHFERIEFSLGNGALLNRSLSFCFELARTLRIFLKIGEQKNSILYRCF
jgi:hypothetical protein